MRLYAGGTLVASMNAAGESAFAVSPAVDLSPGPHALTATVALGSEESPTSPDLKLTIEPAASIDFCGVTITHPPLFGNGPLITDSFEIIIDPYGTVYDADIGLAAPISGAVVTLHQQDPETQQWNLWAPAAGQENPQTTGNDGCYYFMVPEGVYRITVEAADYISYTGLEDIVVSAETRPVELPIPLKRNDPLGQGKRTIVYLPFIIK